MQEISTIYPTDKKELYQLLAAQLTSLCEDVTYVLPSLSNASALLGGALTNINWVGFYLMKESTLILGPFQGKTACIQIPIGRGVCGSAASNNAVMRISNVHEFPGHIACDSASNSEIVLPICHNGIVVGVLDIDSPILNRFDELDEEGLQQIVSILEEKLDWSHFSVN